MTVPAGWYSDPWGHAELRWWNGAQWTGFVAQAADRGPVDDQPTPASGPAGPLETDPRIAVVDVETTGLNMSDQQRKYAQMENEHLLILLLGPKGPTTSEDPEKLAVRNVDATARLFGPSDPLHAMALNTLAFVRLYREHQVETIGDLTRKAIDIVGDDQAQAEMLLEARCLLAWAEIKGGNAAATAILALAPPGGEPSAPANASTAAQTLSEILRESVFAKRLTRILLQMALREIAVALLKEVEAAGDQAALRSLRESLGLFLDVYYVQQTKA